MVPFARAFSRLKEVEACSGPIKAEIADKLRRAAHAAHLQGAVNGFHVLWSNRRDGGMHQQLGEAAERQCGERSGAQTTRFAFVRRAKVPASTAHTIVTPSPSSSARGLQPV